MDSRTLHAPAKLVPTAQAKPVTVTKTSRTRAARRRAQGVHGPGRDDGRDFSGGMHDGRASRIAAVAAEPIGVEATAAGRVPSVHFACLERLS